jgi:hypothetical protein
MHGDPQRGLGRKNPASSFRLFFQKQIIDPTVLIGCWILAIYVTMLYPQLQKPTVIKYVVL